MDRHAMATRNQLASIRIRKAVGSLAMGHGVEGLNADLLKLDSPMHRDSDVSAMLQLEVLAGVLETLAENVKESRKKTASEPKKTAPEPAKVEAAKKTVSLVDAILAQAADATTGDADVKPEMPGGGDDAPSTPDSVPVTAGS